MSEITSKTRRAFAAGALSGALLTAGVLEGPAAARAIGNHIAHENDAAPIPDIHKSHRVVTVPENLGVWTESSNAHFANTGTRAVTASDIAGKAFPEDSTYDYSLQRETKMIQEQGTGPDHELTPGQEILLPLDAHIGALVDGQSNQGK